MRTLSGGVRGSSHGDGLELDGERLEWRSQPQFATRLALGRCRNDGEHDGEHDDGGEAHHDKGGSGDLQREKRSSGELLFTRHIRKGQVVTTGGCGFTFWGLSTQ